MPVIAFKRIGKEPPPPPAPVETPKIPTREEMAKMTPTEAYKAGETFGEAIQAAKKAGISVKDLLSGAAKTNTAVVSSGTGLTGPVPKTSGRLVDQVTTLFKKSDTGIGYKQWSIYVRNGNSVVVEWGHCDKSKVEKVYPFVNRPHLMEAWMREAIAGKIKKGYSRTKAK